MSDDTKALLDSIQMKVMAGRKREIETAKLLQSLHEGLQLIRDCETLAEAKSLAFVSQLKMTTHLHSQTQEMQVNAATPSS